MDEKLKHFDELILKDAAHERDRILQKIRTEMEETVSRKRSEFAAQAEASLKRETAAAEKEKNNRISRVVIEGKQLLMSAREDIMKAVLGSTRKKLCEFASGDGYLPYLEGQIKESCIRAGEGELVVYVDKKDLAGFSEQLEALKKELPAGTAIQALDEDVIGGCRVLNRAENILVDNTLSRKLDLSADHFFEICRLRID